MHPLNRYKTQAWARTRRRILNRDGYRCRCCGRSGRFEVDHIRPIQDGGSHALANLQTLCRNCHFAKTRRENRRRRKQGASTYTYPAEVQAWRKRIEVLNHAA